MTAAPGLQAMPLPAHDQPALLKTGEGRFDGPAPRARILPRRLSSIVLMRAHQLYAMRRQALTSCIRIAGGVRAERFGSLARVATILVGHGNRCAGRLRPGDDRQGRQVQPETSSSVRWTSTWGMVGAWIYLAGFALPVPGNFPLLGLVLCSLLVAATSARAFSPGWSPLTLAVVAFLGATVVSTLVSVDLGRSVRLSTPFLPAVLLFLLVAQHVAGPRAVRRLYLALSAVGLVLASMVLWAAWHQEGMMPVRPLVAHLGVPILVVPNDLTFLALLAPLSLVLLYRAPRGVVGAIAALSLQLSACAILVIQSRTATLTLVLALVGATLLTQRRHRLFSSLAGVLALLLVAFLLNALLFPEAHLLAKMAEKGLTLNGRAALWASAWTLVLEAPLLGHGPHTFGRFAPIPWVHNLYLEVLAEQGLLGLAALGGLLASGLAAGWNLRSAPSEDMRLWGMGALASLMGLCAAGVVELTLLREWVVTMLFTLLGVIAHLSVSSPSPGRSD